MNHSISICRLTAALGCLAGLASTAIAATPAELLSGYAAQAATAPQPVHGQQFFTQLHGREWSCSSCHGTVPTQAGKHAATGKPIGALATGYVQPAASLRHRCLARFGGGQGAVDVAQRKRCHQPQPARRTARGPHHTIGLVHPPARRRACRHLEAPRHQECVQLHCLPHRCRSRRLQ
jgi:hypothetical protein